MNNYFFTFLVLMLAAGPLAAGPYLDIETGPVFTGYNDVRIPGKYGTRLSLPGVLGSKPWYFIRARAGYAIKEQHNISFLAAPLSIDYRGRSSRPLLFKNRFFFPGVPITGTFMFNSYRLTYRYDFIKNEKIEVGIGLTGKIRHAHIRLDSYGSRTTRPDLGFVPLITMRLQWRFVPRVSLLLDVDWLVGPVGRAEDALAAIQYHVNDHVILKAGYRILEGGADNSKVFTFSLFHYAVFGTTVLF
jgi:hypothetical protein